MNGYAGNANAAPGNPPTADSQIGSHARTMANACEMAASNLDRLRRFKARLCGISELGAAGGEQTKPHPDGLLPRLTMHDDDLSRSLNETAKLIEALDGIA